MSIPTIKTQHMVLDLESFVMKNTMSIPTIKTHHMVLNLESFVMKNPMSIPTIKTQHMVLNSEFQIPDFISFIRAGNPVFGPKMGIGNRGFGCLAATDKRHENRLFRFLKIFVCQSPLPVRLLRSGSVFMERSLA